MNVQVDAKLLCLRGNNELHFTGLNSFAFL